jgi:hypothetical protein
MGSGVSSPKVPCVARAYEIGRATPREEAAERLDDKIESDLLVGSNVVRQQDTVAAAAAITVVLDAPEIVVLRLLRGQEHVDFGFEPGAVRYFSWSPKRVSES